MDINMSDKKTKELLTKVIIKLIKTRKGVFSEIIIEALEEVGLASAIIKSRINEFVSKEKIFLSWTVINRE